MAMREVIERVMRGGDAVDPHKVAQRAVAAMDEGELREAAVHGAVRLTREMMREERAGVWPTGEDMPGALRPRSREAGATRRSGASRWGSDRERWLKASVSVAGVWKELGDCTADDCDVLAEGYRARSRQNEAWAARFDQLRDAMVRAGVSRVRDLDEPREAVA